MTEVQRLAKFAGALECDHVRHDEREALKTRVLDAFGCASGALGAPPASAIRAVVDELGARQAVSLVGGGRTAPDRAAWFNGALMRYLDFNDSYLAPGETCHPSDNLAAVLAAAEYADVDGRQLIAALAVAYQVQCRLADAAPVRGRGFDHTTHLAYSSAAGIARALGLTAEQTAHAIAISGASLNVLRVVRTGRLSNWKGLAAPFVANGAMQAAFAAAHGVTGPLEIFEGVKGFQESIAGSFVIDWANERIDRISRTIVKKYDAEVHAQSAVEASLDLRARRGFDPGAIHRVDLSTFGVAYRIIGAGAAGEKRDVRTKEQADHSLPYMVAAALLDGELGPRQYTPDRIRRADVQSLLRKVSIHEDEAFSRQFPAAMPARVEIELSTGEQFATELIDYEGFATRPMPWSRVATKFRELARESAPPPLCDEIIDAVAHLETIRVADLTALLRRLSRTSVATAARQAS